MNWFIKLSQLQPFLKSLGLSDDLINMIQKINIKEVRNKIIELIQSGTLSKYITSEQLNNTIEFFTSNYNTLVTLTDNPHYKKWLINHYLDYSRLEEDKEKFKETLLRLKRSSLDKNINNYQDIPDIARTLDNTKNQINKRNKGGELLNLPDGAELLGTTENGFTVVKITTVPAANLLANGTEWCVVNEEPAQDYLSKGPLYLLYKNNQRYALCHYEENQFMDIYDNPLKDKWEIIKEIETLTGKGIYTNAELAYYYAHSGGIYNTKELYKLENVLATSAEYSYRYAKYILNGPFPKGEDAIATDAEYSYKYAAEVLKGPFPKGEDAIATDAEYTYNYIFHVTKEPFPKGEDIIAKEPYHSYDYAIQILHKRFFKGEEAIKKTPFLYEKYKRIFDIKE